MDDEDPVKSSETTKQLARQVAAIRAGRALLAWSQRHLAERAGLSAQSITRLERMDRLPALKTLWLAQRALEDAGVSYVETDNEAYIKLEARAFEYLYQRLERGEGMTSRGSIWKGRGDESQSED